MKHLHRLFRVASAAFFIALNFAALAQNAGTVTNHAFAIGAGAGGQGYTSLLCGSAQLAVGQSAADPICKTITGDVTISAAGVTAIKSSVALTTPNIGVAIGTSLTLPTASYDTNSGSAAGRFITFDATGLLTYYGSFNLGGGPVLFYTNGAERGRIATGSDWTFGVAGASQGTLTLAGLTSGGLKLQSPAAASGTLTFPAGTTNFSATGGASQVVKQTSVGGAFTVGQLAPTDLSSLGTGVATALAVNVGSAGAPVVNGGSLGTPSSGVGTNFTGTAAGLTAGHVTTNANSTGDVTSVGNATTIAANAVTNAKLATAADGTIKSNISGGTAPPSDNTITAVLDKLGSTQGQVLYRNATTWVPLAPGTAGQFLTTQGTAANPNWSSGGAGTGTVTQVICGTGLSGGTITASGTCAVNLSVLTNSLAADVSLTNTASYFDGPSVAQGSTGVWFASGTVTLNDSASETYNCKLWDGTTVIASTSSVILSTNTVGTISLSGMITSPAGNIRISCRATATTTGKIAFNVSGNSKDSTVSAFRMQ